MRYPSKVLENLEKVREENVLKKVADYTYDAKDVKAFQKGTTTPDVLSRRGVKSEELQGALVEANRKRSVQIEGNSEIANRIIKNLKMNKQDVNDFYTLINYGHDYQVEFDKITLDGWGINDNVQQGYFGWMKQSMAAHESANSIMNKKLKAAGYGTSTRTGDIVKEFNQGQLNTPEFAKMSLLDTNTGEVLNYRNSSIDKIKEDYLDKGYKIYQLYPGEVSSRGLDYTHYLAKNVDEVGPLSEWVLPYVKGGSVAYKPDTHFVKIGRDFYDNEGGRLFHGFPKTLIADSDTKRLEKYAEEVNQVSDMWKRSEGDLAALQRELDEANFQEFKVNSATDVKEMIHTKENPTGFIDPEYKAKVLRNNEKYVYEDNGFGVEQSEEFDQYMSNLMDIKGNYYRSRGDRMLANLNNDYGHVVDPFTMWQRNIELEAFNNTLGRLMVDYGEWFKDTFEKVIDSKGGRYNVNRMSGQEVISTAEIKAPNSDYDGLARAAKRAQMTYANILNTPTKLDIMISNKMQEMLHMLPKRFWDNKTMDKIMSTDVTGWLNAVVYRTYLGFFNIKQFILQGPLQMLNTLAIGGLKGTKALVSLPAVLLGHFFKDTPIIKQIPKLLSGLGGMSPAEFDEFMKIIDNYGTFKQFSKRPELVESMEHSLNIVPHQIDLIFAQMGNNLSQLYADLTAYLMVGIKNPREFCKVSDDLMLNLNRANTSAVQRSSIGKVAAQFTSYPLAAYEIMSGHHLKPWQRVRFTAMQLGMWGIGGTLAKDYITNIYDFVKEHFEDVDPEIVSYALEGVATKYFEELGVDINEGTDLLGMVNQLSSLIMVLSDMFGGSAPELPVSAVPTIIIDNYNMLKDIIAPSTDTFDLLHWAKETNRRRGVFSGVKNFTKYLYAKDAKAFLDRNGKVLRENPTEMQQWAQLLGFGPAEAKWDYRSLLRENNIREAVKDTFENTVRKDISLLITFRDTGRGNSELAKSRDSQQGYVIGKAEESVKQFYAWVDYFHPEHSKYARTLVRNAYSAGDDKKYMRTKAQQQYFEEQSGVE